MPVDPIDGAGSQKAAQPNSGLSFNAAVAQANQANQTHAAHSNPQGVAVGHAIGQAAGHAHNEPHIRTKDQKAGTPSPPLSPPAGEASASPDGDVTQRGEHANAARSYGNVSGDDRGARYGEIGGRGNQQAGQSGDLESGARPAADSSRTARTYGQHQAYNQDLSRQAPTPLQQGQSKVAIEQPIPAQTLAAPELGTSKANRPVESNLQFYIQGSPHITKGLGANLDSGLSILIIDSPLFGKSSIPHTKHVAKSYSQTGDLELALSSAKLTGEETGLVHALRSRGAPVEQIFQTLSMNRLMQSAEGYDRPGVLFTRHLLPAYNGLWLAGLPGLASLFPAQVALILQGCRFENFSAFRAVFWKTVANTAELAASFRNRICCGCKTGWRPLPPPRSIGEIRRVIFWFITCPSHRVGQFST